MGNKISEIKIGSILSYAQMFVGIIIGLLYTPIMIRILGQSEYGLYSTVSSAISMLSILSLGFNSGYVRYYAKYKRENAQKEIERLNGLFLIVFSIIGIVALVCGLFLCFNLQLVFSDGLTAAEYEVARVLVLLLTVNMAVSFPMSVFTSVISTHEKFVFLKTIGILKTVVGPMVTLPLLLAGYRSIAMVTVSVTISLFVDGCYLFYAMGKLKCRFAFSGFERGLFRTLFTYTIFIAINLIVDQINWNIDKILLGRFCGTEMVAVYAVGFSLNNYYTMFSTSVSSVFTPRIHHIVNAYDVLAERREKLTEIFVKVGRVQFLILALVATGIVFFGKSFILNVWVGSGYEDSYYVALLLILPVSVPLIQNIGIEIQRAQDKHRFRAISYLFMAIINFGMSIYLCQRYGAIGSAIGTAISLVAANGIIMNIYYHKQCNINIKAFWIQILKMSKGLILPIIAGCCINRVFDTNKVGWLILSIVLYTLIYAGSMWLFGMNEYERDLIRNPVARILKRRADK